MELGGFAPASAVVGRLHSALTPISAQQLCVMLMRPNKAKMLGDMAVHMHKVLARLWVGVRECHLLFVCYVKHIY